MRFVNFIFDLDGTLIESAPGIQAAFEYSWKSIYPDQPAPDIKRSIGPPIQSIFLSFAGNASESDISCFIRGFREAYDQWGWKLTSLFDDVIPFLQILQRNNCRCFGVTNKPARPTRQILNALEIEKAFTVFLSPDSSTPPFANKTMAIEHLLRQYQLNNEQTVMVGDSAEDAEAAHRAQIAFIFRNNDLHPVADRGFPIFYCCKDLSECSSIIGVADDSVA